MIYFCCSYSSLKCELTGEYWFTTDGRLRFIDTTGITWSLCDGYTDYYILIDDKKYSVADCTCTELIEKIGNDLHKFYIKWYNAKISKAIDNL